VIKFEGESGALIWKHPSDDFNTTSQLIVHESQEAIFFRNGEALDLFTAGRYTLETQNIPILRNLLNLPTGGVSPFHCEVYFINKVMTLNVKWGTNTSSEVIDPQFNILINIGASGGMGIQVADSRKFLIKLVGTEPKLTADRLQGYFRENIATRVKSYITRIMSEVSFVVVNAQLNDISVALHNQLSGDMKDFGINLVNFYVSTIHIPDDDKQRIKDALAAVSGWGMVLVVTRLLKRNPNIGKEYYGKAIKMAMSPDREDIEKQFSEAREKFQEKISKFILKRDSFFGRYGDVANANGFGGHYYTKGYNDAFYINLSKMIRYSQFNVAGGLSKNLDWCIYTINRISQASFSL
jgi:hypothetical protein